MKVVFTIFSCAFFFINSFAQHASSDSCRIYKISRFNSATDVPNHTIHDVLHDPDTSYFLSVDQVNRLNNFLDENARYKVPDNLVLKDPFNIIIVISFHDDAGKNHWIGFDYYGNYELDGVYYHYDDRLASVENELEIGIIPHKQMLNPGKYNRKSDLGK
jgi:hypothetical protein